MAPVDALSSTTSKSRAQLVWQYPQGLLKLEPGEMTRLAVRRPKNPEGASASITKLWNS